MKNKLIFAISLLGILAGMATAYFFGIKKPPLPPAFDPASSPYASAIYAEGIIESAQTSGENINIYPEVAGTVKEILVSEGQQVKAGQLLLQIDDSIQKATAEQQGSQAEAAKALLEELKAQPRRENLEVAGAQVSSAEASLKTAQDTLQKQEEAYEIDPRSVSKDALDGALNAAAVAQANLEVAKRQYELTKAGAWVYDIRNQERQQYALERAHAASGALLAKYALRAPRRHCAVYQHDRRELCISAGILRRIYTGHRSHHDFGEFSCLSPRSLLRRRNSGSTAAFGLQNESANVDSRVNRQGAARLCESAAFRISEN